MDESNLRLNVVEYVSICLNTMPALKDFLVFCNYEQIPWKSYFNNTISNDIGHNNTLTSANAQ